MHELVWYLFELNASKVEHDHIPNIPSRTAQCSEPKGKENTDQTELIWIVRSSVK